MIKCYDYKMLVKFAAGAAEKQDVAAIVSHLSECPRCRSVVRVTREVLRMTTSKTDEDLEIDNELRNIG